jgi:alpha-glucosidase
MRFHYRKDNEGEWMQRVQRGFFTEFSLLMVATLIMAGCLQTLEAQSAPPAGPGAINAINYPPREGSYNPVADPHAMVILNHARFSVLTPQMIRLEWAADGKFEDHASLVFINRKLPPPQFTSKIEESGGSKQLLIKTAKLELRYSPAPDGDGKFSANNLVITFELNGKSMTWRPGQADTGNLLGTTRTLDGALGDKTKEPIQPGLVSRDGWTVVDDSARLLFDSADFSFPQGEQSRWPWVMLRPEGDRQDWYFFGYGHEYRQALNDYVKVAGRIPLPPRFAFGTWWSRYWAYSDQELDDLVQGFHENDTPLDVLVIDMDWHPTFGMNFSRMDQSGHPVGWSGYTWNKLLFPDPGLFLKHIHEEGLKVTLNMHPASGVQPWEDAYPAMARAMGIDPATKKYVPFDITNKKFATNYMDILHHPLEKQGIDFWWLDWQQEAQTSTAGLNPTWWLNYVHFTDQEREGKRPLLFHRWGGLGNHRYQIGFSGDTVSVWESLAFQPWFTATAANVAYAYWSHDIGGHMPGAVGLELYARWIQFGAFSPILRTHTTKNPESERRIWAYPEPYSGVMRRTFQLRYALQPYIYTEARRTYDTGAAFFAPLYYDWPEADAAYQSRNEYLFGSAMLVSPVTQPMDTHSLLASENVWIPDGEWFEWPTGKYLQGPASVKRSFSIEQIPVYVRAGAIVPMQPAMRYTGEKPVDPLIINVFPMKDGQKSTYTVYEDASQSEAYKRGVCAWTEIDSRQSGDDLDVDIQPVRGTYPGMVEERGYELRLPGDWPPESVTVDNQRLGFVREAGKTGWRYEGNTLTTVVNVPPVPVSAHLRIRVHRREELLARRSELDGFAGRMTRLRGAYDALNAAWPITWSPDSLIDAMQTGDRLSYHPEGVQPEIAHFQEVYAQAITWIQAKIQEASGTDKDVTQRLRAAKQDPNITQEQSTFYKQMLQRALTQVEDGRP